MIKINQHMLQGTAQRRPLTACLSQERASLLHHVHNQKTVMSLLLISVLFTVYCLLYSIVYCPLCTVYTVHCMYCDSTVSSVLC